MNERSSPDTITLDDLVKNLRERAKYAREEHTGTSDGDAYYFDVAADNIDRLRATQPATPTGGEVTKSAPDLLASQNTAERDPSVMPDWAGADTRSSAAIGEPVAWQFRQRSAVGKGPQSSLPWCDWICIEREDYDRYVREPNKLVQVRPLYADAAQAARQPIYPIGDDQLSKLWNAIVDNTQGDGFWIGEILLNELEKETGFNRASLVSSTEGK